MDKEAQDKLWNELSEEKRDRYRNLYQKGLDYVRNEDGYLKGLGQGELNAIVDLFGEHNLNPEPQIKTWEDVEKEGYKIFDDYRGEDVTDLHSDYRELGNYCDCICLQGFNYDLDRERPDNKIILKAIATLKIAKLIDLSYGGMVSEEEWKDEEVEKYFITPIYNKDKTNLSIGSCLDEKYFIAFHTEQQAEEFMSHESNRKLVEQYYLM